MEWKVRFQDYVKFQGVKESINAVKVRTKQQKLDKGVRLGDLLEDVVQTIVERVGIISVERLTPRYDMGFGADFKFSYEKDDRSHSFFVDVTSKMDSNMRYFGLRGDLVDSEKDAFCYYTDEFKVYFSIKYNHHGFFFYEKPVVSFVVRGFDGTIDTDKVDLSHSININNIMISLHEHLCEQGHGIRASHYVFPNKNRFYADYKKFQRSN